VNKIIIFGSFVNSMEPRDIDIAVFLYSDEPYLSLVMKSVISWIRYICPQNTRLAVYYQIMNQIMNCARKVFLSQRE